MSEHQKLKETLSAFFDDEAGKLDQLELRRLVRSLEDNADLLETYQRYTLARAALNGETNYASSRHLFANVRAALEGEEMDAASAELVSPPVHGYRAPATKMRGLKALGRVAIAASVAIVVVYAVQLHSPISNVALSPQTVTPSFAAATNTQTDQGNRVLDPRVMTVSAGGNLSSLQVGEESGKLPVGCAIGVMRDDSANLVWEKELPAGYVLCKQNDQMKRCEPVSSKIGCYLD